MQRHQRHITFLPVRVRLSREWLLLASRKLLTALACAVAQLAGTAAAPSDVFFVQAIEQLIEAMIPDDRARLRVWILARVGVDGRLI